MKQRIIYLLMMFLFAGMACCSDEDDPGTVLVPEPPTPEPPGIETEANVNLARGGVATASSYADGRSPAFLIDGKIEANENEGYYSSIGSPENHTEWVQIEMREEHTINELWVYPRYDGVHAGYPVDFTLEISMEGEIWETVYTVTDNPPVTDALPRKYSFADTEAKFVRLVATNLYTTNNEWTGFTDTYILQLSEIEIYKRSQSILAIQLDRYFAEAGDPIELNITVKTEQTPTNTQVIAELLTTDEKVPPGSPITQTGVVTDNEAELKLNIPAELPEGDYLVKITIKGETITSTENSNTFKVSAANGKTYYVSSSRGNDTNDGLSEDTPFKTLTKASEVELKPGSKILLRSTDVWQNQTLQLSGIGTKENPIVIGAYGSGAKPIISPGFNTTYAIRVVNGSGYEIRGLEVMNCYGGIVFWYENTYYHSYLLIENCYIHQVTGTSTNWGNGWGQKMPVDLVLASGICINGSDNYGNSRICEDITIRNCQIDRCDVGIQFISRDHDPSGQWDYHGKDKTTPNNFHNIKISDCDVTRSYRTGGICLSCVDSFEARNILVDETGYDGIGMYWGVAAFQVSRATNGLVENCTFSNTIKGDSPDGQGFDFEADVQHVTVRKCKFLNNDASGVLCYGDSWPGINSNNVVDECYFEGNNRTDDERIFNIGKPANSGIVKNSVIRMANKATNFYSYPLVFDESNRVYNSAGELIYKGGPSRENPWIKETFSPATLTGWENGEQAVITNGQLMIPAQQMIYVKDGTAWNNYFIETSFICKTDVATPGINFRIHNHGKNYYLAKVKLLRNYRSTIDLFRVEDGRESSVPLASYPCYSMVKETQYMVRIEAEGTLIRVFMDGNLMGSYTDNSFTQGSAGLSNNGEGTTLFDQVLICPL